MLHRGPPTSHPLDEYVVPLLEYRPTLWDTIICDRWHVGETVYPRVLKRHTDMDHAVHWYIELFLESRGVVVSVLCPSLEELLDRYMERGDDYIPIDKLALIHRYFEKHARVRGAFPTPDAMLDTAQGVTLRALHIGGLITYVGPPLPKVVYVGDVRGPANHPPLAPAFMPYRGSSGHYLMRALISARPTEVKIGLINACDVDDIEAAHALLGFPQLIALGRNAERKLRRLGFDFAAAPHPQYVRRFHHSALEAYGRLLVDLIGTDRNELQWGQSLGQARASASTARSSSASSRRGSSD
jgi:hypothetical protein